MAWLVGLAPILVLPGLQNRWGWPTLLAVLAAGVLALWARASGRFPRWFVLLLIALCLWLGAVSLAGDAPLAQLLGRAPRYEGFITLGVLIVAGWIGARSWGPGAGRHRTEPLIAASAVAAFLLAGVAVLETFDLRPLPSDLARPGSLAGNATDQGILGAILCAVLASTALGVWRREQRLRWIPVSGAVAAAVAVATSNSRAGLLALAIIIAGLIVRFLVTARQPKRDAIRAGLAALGVFAVVVSVPLTRDRLFGISAFAQQTVGDRFLMWEDAWALFLTSPLTGVGLNGFADGITPFFGDEWFTRAQVGSILDSPHNIIVQSAVIGGVPGLALAAVLVIGALVAGIRRLHIRGVEERDLMLAALITIPAAGVALLTHVTSPVVLVPLAVLTGILAAEPSPLAARSRTRAVRAVASAVGVIWFIFLAGCTVADAKLIDAQIALREGEVLIADRAFEAAQNLRPWDADVSLLGAQAFGAALEHGMSAAAERAETWARRAVLALPNSTRAQYLAGMIALENGKIARAAQRLARAAELSPADPRTQHGYGVALLISGAADAAREPLIRAIELAPDSETSWKALGDACAMIGDMACVEAVERREWPEVDH